MPFGKLVTTQNLLRFGLGPALVVSVVVLAVVPEGKLDNSVASKKRLHGSFATPGPSNPRTVDDNVTIAQFTRNLNVPATTAIPSEVTMGEA
ncbi:unnamed protein product [Ilex paraguariensis]|uniref:Uncharacterized protein n=1 Tax=Ilex paraguariensis TaxID=185542 RepID=A0ABC8TWE4_9AQUA